MSLCMLLDITKGVLLVITYHEDVIGHNEAVSDIIGHNERVFVCYMTK